MMKIDVLTLFPEMFTPLEYSILGNAQENAHFSFKTHNFRNFPVNKHGHVDDYPYGGGAGMLLRIEPIIHQLEALNLPKNARIILVDPTGEKFNQSIAQSWSREDHLVFICGHYEGFDERIRDYVTDEVSIGDYVLTNGEIPAMVMIDAVVRLLPDVVGNKESIISESHTDFLLEYPQYTRPAVFRNQSVPDILLSGHHANIKRWRREESLRKTLERRPDLIRKANLTEADKKYIKTLKADD